ncbi:hypothetical protein C1H76_5107 [Elsinoe australis]|uniref:Uncharacterized protein n=1 Tax=Elsinoe australis TaxID=40998 RepID=A0A4U7AVZ1_9PEZI|nr:hypothetical protein C1H76_5107 [Elsinoe australis]
MSAIIPYNKYTRRGTGNTLRFSCYPNNDQRLAAYARNPISSNASDTALGRIWAVSQLDADTCFMVQNETGSFIGTGFTARDFMQVVDALDADGLLRFWGQSYGTLLGATLAAMYPDRIERMILDGVVDPIEYTYGSDYPQYTDTDAVFSTFCTACAANPTTCPLTQSPTNTTLSPPEIANTLTTLLTATKQVPIPLHLSTGPYLLDAATLKSLLYVIFYSPSAWPYYSTLFAALRSPDPASLAPFIPVLSALVSTNLGLDDEAVYGIRCSDKTFWAERIEDVLPGLRQRQRASYFGDNDANFVGCARWRFEARGRYDGDFKANTRKGVLVVGNTGDPATPLGNARVEWGRLAGSRVLEHGGFGHSIFAQAGRCTARVVRAYWVEGTLPRKGTKCEVDVGLWDGKTGWEEVVAEMDAEGSGAV